MPDFNWIQFNGSERSELSEIITLLIDELNTTFFFIFRVIYTCIVFRNHVPRTPWFKSLLFTFFMIFIGQEIVAFICFTNSPLIENIIYCPMFLIIWFAINCSPYDFVFRILNLDFLYSIMHIFYSVIQVHHIYQGIKIGHLKYGEDVIGLSLISTIFSSSESFVFIITMYESRNFSSNTFLRNFVFSILLSIHSVYHFFEYSLEECSIAILIVYLILSIINNIAYGSRSDLSIDITCISYIFSLFTYHGFSITKKF